MARQCRGCNGPIPPQKGPGHPREFCEDCRPSPPKASPSPPSPVVSEIRPGAQTENLTLAAASMAKLRAAAVLDAPQGVLVMQLARSIDQGGHSGASLASLSREYGRALDAALAVGKAPTAADDGVQWDVG